MIPTPKQIDDFSRRAIAGLPDSLEMQKSDLAVLAFILPRNCPARNVAKQMLAALGHRDKAQQEFLFPRHDGQTGKDGQ